jgi:hypothetical protein
MHLIVSKRYLIALITLALLSCLFLVSCGGTTSNGTPISGNTNPTCTYNLTQNIVINGKIVGKVTVTCLYQSNGSDNIGYQYTLTDSKYHFLHSGVANPVQEHYGGEPSGYGASRVITDGQSFFAVYATLANTLENQADQTTLSIEVKSCDNAQFSTNGCPDDTHQGG